MSQHLFNQAKTFPPCSSPADSNVALPFLLDEMDFSVWFKTLASLDDNEKCQNIFSVLQILNTRYQSARQSLHPRTRLFFLEKLGAVLDSAAAMVSQSQLSEPALKKTDAAGLESAQSTIPVWSLLELANAYAHLTEEETFKQDAYFTFEEKSLVLYNGLYALGKAFLYIAQTYSLPQNSFWQLCYRFYQTAQSLGLVDPAFNKDHAKIENAFKRILVFSLSHSNQFSQQEMRTIYELLGIYSAYASLLTSVPKRRFNGIPVVRLNSGQPPVLLDDEDDTAQSGILHVATVNVASKILEATYDRRTHHQPVDRLMLLRLAKTLTLNKQRKDPRSIAQSNHLGIMGFDAIVEFARKRQIEEENLSHTEQEINKILPGEIQDLDFEVSEIREHFLTNPGKGLLSGHEFQVVEFADPSAIWRSVIAEESVGINVHLLDRSKKGYGLLWTDHLIKPNVGNIVGILGSSVTIGLIRWLVRSKETGMFMGIELLGGNADTIEVSNPGYPEITVPAIYLPHEENHKLSASLVFLHQKEFQPNEFIFLHAESRSIRYRITKQQNLTAFINHVEIVRSY
jgi:hypothetical protein